MSLNRAIVHLPRELDGAALETLFFQHYRALVEFKQLDQKPFYWRTANKVEVDFVSYGEEGLFAFEIKRSALTRNEDLDSLRLFKEDYPMAKCFLLNLSHDDKIIDDIKILNFEKALWAMPDLFS